MTNNGKRTRGKKPANYRYGVPTRNGRGSVDGRRANRDATHVHSLTDPFCDAARGSRIPDDDSAPSVPVTLKTVFTLGTDATGSAALKIRPQPSSTMAPASAISGTTVTTWGPHTAMTDYTALAASFSQYRMVSYGVRIYPIVAPTAQSGTLRVITMPENSPTGVNLGGGMWEAVTSVALSEADVHWVGKPQGTTWKEYIPIANVSDFSHLDILLQGGPASTSTYVVEITMNMECLVVIGSIVSAVAKPGAPSNPRVLEAASKVHSKHNGHHTDGRPSMLSKMWGLAKGAILDVASQAIPYVGGSIARALGGRQRSSYPAIMDVD